MLLVQMFHCLLPNLKLTAILHLKSWVELLDVALRHVTPEGEVKGLHADGSKIRDRIQALEIFEISRLAPGATFFQIISLKENPKKCIETLRFWEHGGEILVFF